MQQTVWSGYPLSLPYELTLPPRPPYTEYPSPEYPSPEYPSPEYLSPGYPSPEYPSPEYPSPGLVLPPRVIPYHHNMVIEKPSPKECRKYWLDRSVFDMVEAHKYLALTDQRLLGWYLSLTAEDRKIIQDEGGFNQFLHRHPLLELSRHHVYVKCFASFCPAQPAVTPKRPMHVSQCSASGATNCRPDLEMLPNNIRETLTLLGCSNSGDGSSTYRPNHQQPHTVTGSSHLTEQRPSCQVSSSISSAAVCKDPAAHVSFSLDMDLERRRQGGKPELRSQTAMTQGQSRANSTYAEVSPSQSEWPTGDRDTSSQYYSFDSIHMDGTEYCDRTIIQPVEPEHVSSPLTQVVEGGRDHTVHGNDDPVDDDEARLRFESQSDSFHSIMKNDKSILACLTSEDMKAHNSGVHSGAVTTDTEALTASCKTLKSDQSLIQMNTAEKSPSPMPCATTCDVMVGTEPTLCKSAVTQTEGPETADKHVITEVHMSDLDYLAEEFIKLMVAQEKRKRPNIPANIVSVLQKLESDYNQMRDKILAEVPLEKTTTGASVVPAQVGDDVLDNVPSRSEQPEKHKTSGEESGCPDDESRNGCQRSRRKDKQIKMGDSKAQRAVPRVPQDRDAIQKSHKPEERQTTAACKELGTCEAWYDAEEDLQPAGPAAAETGQDPTVTTDKTSATDSASEEVKSSVLCVSNLPSNVTESDVMLWFEKYHASEVSISALKNDLRVAIVMISGPQSAEAAARELHGCCMQGRTLHVEHINRASEGSQSRASASISGSESSQDEPQTRSSSSARKLISQPPLSSSIKKRTVVCISPTAKGTCVPQHFGTMGSFDTLMSELTRRHPDVGRQRIVDALMELKAEHQGVLSGLPLRTIREMTSELLTRPASATAF